MLRLLPILALCFFAETLPGQQLFILFDGSCGQEVRYEQAVTQQPRTDYYAYHFPLADGTRLMLETGTTGGTTQSTLPQDYVYCGDPRLNAELVSRVKSGQVRLFVLTPDGRGQFNIQPVETVARLQRTGNRFTYESNLTGFEFDMENGIIGENLAYNNPGAKVYFEGRESSPCTGYFLFRQLNQGAPYPVIDYRISPEIGLLERRLGSDGMTTSGGVLLAREVNGMPVGDYISSVCTASTLAARTGQAPGSGSVNTPTMAAAGVQQPMPYNPPVAPASSPNNMLNEYDNQPVRNPPVLRTVQPESQAYQAPQTVTTTLTHTVEKGQTLYAISKLHGTTVDALKVANGLTNNTVYVGQQLEVPTTSTIGNSPPAAAPPATTVPTLPYDAGNVAGSNPGAPAPTPYGAVATPQPYRPAPQAYGQTASRSVPLPYEAPRTAVGGEVYKDLHVVQPGETVASVALKYGYTSAKFREINELGPNDYLRVGQELKTSDCNCPPARPAAAPAPATAPTPQSYGGAPAQAQPYGGAPAGRVTPQPNPAGTPMNTPPALAPAYTPGALADPPRQEALGSPARPAAAPGSVINNDPNFGRPVPNVSAPPTRTMSDLEGAPAAAPATYGNQPVATPRYPVPAYEAGQTGRPAATPNPYGGTPVGVTAPAATLRQAPAAPRAFHIVQDGETLASIAQRYGLTTKQVRELNGLRSTDVVLTYQKLYVE